MHIHRYEKLWLGIALLLIVAFIGTVTYGAIGPGVAMVNNDNTVNPNNLGNHPQFSNPGVRQVGPNEYDVYVVAQQFIFRPGSTVAGQPPITVPANSTVHFHVTSADVIHGFNVVGTNLNTMAIPGEVSTMTVEVNEPKEYGIVCHEYCGQGHHTMEGQFKVVPEDEYNGSEQ